MTMSRPAESVANRATDAEPTPVRFLDQSSLQSGAILPTSSALAAGQLVR